MNEIIKVMYGLDVKEVFQHHPGLMDRGVMLGIPPEISFQLLAGMVDVMPTTDTITYPDVYTRDILLDIIGYFEDDWVENRTPGIDVVAIQAYYEEGMIMAAVMARQQLPKYTYEVSWSDHYHPDVIYLVVATHG